jgi:hypothetical protein
MAVGKNSNCAHDRTNPVFSLRLITPSLPIRTNRVCAARMGASGQRKRSYGAPKRYLSSKMQYSFPYSSDRFFFVFVVETLFSEFTHAKAHSGEANPSNIPST